jgi:hypothetical protein
MRKTAVEITTFSITELTPAAHARALQRIVQIIQHTWANDPSVQALLGLTPNSTEAESRAAQPRVHAWIMGMQTKLERELEFLPSGEPFDVGMFSEAIAFVPPEKPEDPKLLVPEKRLVGPDGRIIPQIP